MILLGYSQSSEPAIPCGIRELAAAIVKSQDVV